MKKTICLLAIIAALLFSACGKQEGAPTAVPAASYDYLRLAGGDPATLDPHLVTDVGSHLYVGKLFSGLLRMDLLAVDKNNNDDFTEAGEIQGNYEKNDVEKALREALPQGLAFFDAFKAKGREMRALYKLIPDIAKEIPEPVYNPDGTAFYTFQIRDEAKFRNGRNVTAWDFAYSFDRAADPRTMSSTAEMYLGDILGVWEMLNGREYGGKKLINRVYQFKAGEAFDISKEFVDLPGVRVIGEKTLEITAKNVLPVIFYWHMTYPVSFVIDKVQVDATRSWTENPNGTGPYWLEKKVVGQIVLRVNDLYYGFKPLIEKRIYDTGGGSTFSSYENNEIDMTGVGIADIQAVRDASSALAKEAYETVDMSTSYIGFNTKEAPFDDTRVRQAFAMAIDKDWLAEKVLENMAQVAHGVLPPGMPGYRPDLKGLEFNPQKAKELLAQSKYGDSLPRIKLTISGTGSAPSVVLQAIVKMWEDNLGAKVELDSIDYVTFLDQIKKGQFQMFSLGWVADYPDPEDFIDLKFHSKRSKANNETGYANSKVDELVELARTEKDAQKRIRLYQEAEDIIIEESPWLLLFHSKEIILVKPYIHDFFPSPMGISNDYMRFK